MSEVQATHWEGCEDTHLNCAFLKLEEARERIDSIKRNLRETLEVRGVNVPKSFGINDTLTLYAKTLDRACWCLACLAMDAIEGEVE